VSVLGAGYLWVFAGPWLAIVGLAIWIASTVSRLLRHAVAIRHEIEALRSLARALSPFDPEPPDDLAELRPRCRSAPEKLLALRGTAALGPRVARTAAVWLLLARDKLGAGGHAPELARLGLGFALDREVHALVK
jgi:hypothetical protein